MGASAVTLELSHRVMPMATVAVAAFLAASTPIAENPLVIHDPWLAAEYRANWATRRAVSVPYVGPIDVGAGGRGIGGQSCFPGSTQSGSYWGWLAWR